MDIFDIRRQNIVNIFDSIMRGNNTLNAIAKDTGVTKMTASELTRDLISKGIIKYDTFPRTIRGKRPYIYSIVDNYHCMFFEETPRSFSCISLDVNGHVIDRFDHIFRKELSKKQNVDILFQKFRKKPAFKKYCIEVLACCSSDTAKYLPKNVNISTKENIILDNLSERDKVVLFNMGSKIILSTYSHYHTVSKGVKEKTINKVLNVDKVYTFHEQLYDGLFLAMQVRIINKLREMI